MKPVYIIVSVLLAAILIFNPVVCYSRFFGEKTNNTLLIHRDKLKYEAIPLKKRIKVLEYKGTTPINAINCYDYQNSEASVNITEGGIGYNYVTLRLKSQRSYRLNYAIEIYGSKNNRA